MNRFDIPESVKKVIEAAVNHKILDAADFYALAVKHSKNYMDMVSEVVEAAYCCIHHNWDGHKAVAQAADKAYQDFYK